MRREALSLPLALSFLCDKVLLALRRESAKELEESQRNHALVEAREFLSLAAKGQELMTKNLFDATLVDAANYYGMIFDTFSTEGRSADQQQVEKFLQDYVSVIDKLLAGHTVSDQARQNLITFFTKIRDYSNELLSRERTFERTSYAGDTSR